MFNTVKPNYNQWHNDAITLIFNNMTVEQKTILYEKFNIPLGTSLNLIGKTINEEFNFIPKEILIEASHMIGLDAKQIASFDFINKNQYQLSQDKAKKKIATAIYYQTKLLSNLSNNIGSALKPMSPLLLAGNTGVGKTFIIQKATQFAKLNFIHIDASSLVPTGIVGYRVPIHN